MILRRRTLISRLKVHVCVFNPRAATADRRRRLDDSHGPPRTRSAETRCADHGADPDRGCATKRDDIRIQETHRDRMRDLLRCYRRTGYPPPRFAARDTRSDQTVNL